MPPLQRSGFGGLLYRRCFCGWKGSGGSSPESCRVCKCTTGGGGGGLRVTSQLNRAPNATLNGSCCMSHAARDNYDKCFATSGGRVSVEVGWSMILLTTLIKRVVLLISQTSTTTGSREISRADAKMCSRRAEKLAERRAVITKIDIPPLHFA